MASLSDFAELILNLRNDRGIGTLVETGTYQGISTLWAAIRFNRVLTIEKQISFHEDAKERCIDYPNIDFILGDSREVLAPAIANIASPLLFWLDAHNENSLFGNGPNDCPILEELDAIFARANPTDVILIDDLHCFIRPTTGFPSLYLIRAKALDFGFISRQTRNALLLFHHSHQVRKDLL